MSRFTLAMVKKWVPNWELTHVQSIRKRYGLLGGWVSILVNFLIFIIKMIIGLTAHSMAIIADAIHTLSDVLTSGIVIIAFQIAGKPSDKKHPYGHGRIEAIGTLLVATFLIVAGVEVCKSSIVRIYHPLDLMVSWWMIISIAITIVMKELLTRFSADLAKMIHSSALAADAWHHRTDAISSGLVIIALIAQRVGIPWLDGITGVGIGIFLIVISIKIMASEIDDIIGKRPPTELIQDIKKTAASIPDVIDAHDVIVHQYGSLMVISLHIAVSEDLSVRAAHSVSEEVETLINTKYHTHTTVHIDPINTKDHETQKVHAFLHEFIDNNSSILSFHDVRLENKEDIKYLIFDIVLVPDISNDEQEQIRNQLRERLHDAFPFISGIIIEVEPKYVL